MPWVATEAWVGEIADDGMLRDARPVAGGADEALFQPEWSPDGDLYLVSDRAKGWWNLYRERAGALEPMAPREAEFGRAQWTFGMSTYAFESAERLICCFLEDGKWNLAKLDTRTRRFDLIPTRFTDLSQLRASPGRVVFIGGTPTEPSALIDLDLNTGTDRVVRRSAHLSEEVRSYVSRPESITFSTQGDETARALFYPPFSDKFTSPARREDARARQEPWGTDRIHIEHSFAGGAVLDEPWHRCARCELSREHGIRPFVPASVETAVGHF